MSEEPKFLTDERDGILDAIKAICDAPCYAQSYSWEQLAKSRKLGLQPMRLLGCSARKSSNADLDDNTTFVITMKSLAKAGDEYALGWVEEHEAQQAGAIDWAELVGPLMPLTWHSIQGRLTRKSPEHAADTESIKEQIRSAIGCLDFGDMMKRLWKDMNDPYNDAFGEITYAATPKEPSMLTRVVEAIYAWRLCDDYKPLLNHLRSELRNELALPFLNKSYPYLGFDSKCMSPSPSAEDKVTCFRLRVSPHEVRQLDEQVTKALLSSFMTVMRTTGKAMGVDEAHWTAVKAHASVSAPGNKSEEDVVKKTGLGIIKGVVNTGPDMDGFEIDWSSVDFSNVQFDSKGLEAERPESWQKKELDGFVAEIKGSVEPAASVEESEGDRLAKFFARSEHVKGLASYPVRREPLVTTWDMDGFTVQERVFSPSFNGVVDPRKEYNVILGSKIPKVNGCAVAGLVGIIIADDYIGLDLPWGKGGGNYYQRSGMSVPDMVEAAFRHGVNTPLVDANGKDITTQDQAMYGIAKTARMALSTFYDKYRGRMIEDVATIDAIVKQSIAAKKAKALMASAITEEELLTGQW